MRKEKKEESNLLDESFEDFNELIEREENKEESHSEEDSKEIEEEKIDEEVEGIDEELLQLEEINRQPHENKGSKENKEPDLTGIYRLLAYMHKEGEEGTIHPNEHKILNIFRTEGINRIEGILQDRSKYLIEAAEELFKASSEFKRMNKQKPIKQRIKIEIAERIKQNKSRYNSIPFISSIIKDFCYKTGIKIYKKKAQKIKTKENTKTYERLIHFSQGTKEYLWSEEKNEEFIKCIFKG